MTDVDKAETVSRQRAILFYLMSFALLIALFVSPGPGEAPLAGEIVWAIEAVLMALNLTPFADWLRQRRLMALINDETTQAHRQMSFAAGFWAAMASALAIGFLPHESGFDPARSARIIISAGLIAALCSFATLELRAARG